MAKGYRRVDRGQQFLLPVDMAQWLPADHLVWFVIEVVAGLDTAAFHARARLGGKGRAGFDPDMLLTLLVYAYAHGVRSSRRIERLCHTDVAFRIVCAQQPPDHTVIARFRQVHEQALAQLFGQVLVICVRAGMGQFGYVAFDGTKIAANASMDRGRDEAGLRRLAEQWLAEAAATDAAEDAAEDAAPGSTGSDRVPPAARDPQRIQTLLDEVAAERAERAEQVKAERVAAAQAKLDRAQATLEQMRVNARARARRWRDRVAAAHAAGQRVGGSPANDEHDCYFVRRSTEIVHRARTELDQALTAPATPDDGWRPRRNLTDPDSRVLPTRRGWIQGYNAQLAVTADYLILAADLCQDSNDCQQYQPLLHHTQTNLAHIHAATGVDTTIGTVLADAGYASTANLTSPGPDRLIALGKAHQPAGHIPNPPPADPPPADPPPADADPRTRMAQRLSTDEGKQLYRKRAATAEPVNGHLKDRRGLRQFARRGLTAARSELQFAAAVTNLLRLHTQQPTTG